MYDVVLLTDARYVNPKKTDWYIEQILTEDGLVQSALEKHDLKVIKVDWADPNFDWATTRLALFRTTWDYFHRYEEFSTWLSTVSQQTKLVNPVEQIRWNMDKHYLRDLNQKGINIPATHFIEQGMQLSLTALHDQLGWENTVLKPTFSGGARHTYKLDKTNLSKHETIFSELIKNEALMLQPFQNNIIENGEASHMVFGGQYSHSVLKVAKKGDFRVQDDFGGSVHEYSPSTEEITFVEKVVAACDPEPIYARVDVIKDNNGNYAVVELELIEPELWFRNHQPAADLLANSILKILN